MNKKISLKQIVRFVKYLKINRNLTDRLVQIIKNKPQLKRPIS